MLHSEVSVVMSITLLSSTCFILKSVLSWASLSYPEHASFWSQCCHEHHSPIQHMLHSEVSVVMSITLLSRSCFILKSVLSWASLSYPEHASFWSQCCHEHHSPIQNMLHSEVSIVMSITLLSRSCFILKSVLSWASLSYPEHASFWSQCCHEHHSPIQNMLHSEVSVVMSITLLSRTCFILKSVLSWASLSYPDHASFWSQCCHEHHSPIQIMLHSEVSVVMSITLLSRTCFILKSVLSWASLSYPDHASFWSQYCHEHHSPIQIMLHSEVSVVMSITLLSRTCFILKSVLSWASLSYPDHASFWSQCCHEHHSPIQIMLHSEVSIVMSITLLSRSCFILKSVLSWASLSYPDHASFWSQCCHEHHSPIQNMLHSEVSVVMSITLLSRTCFILKSVLSWASLSYPDHASFWSQYCHEHHSPIQIMLHSEVSVVMSITLLSRTCFILKSVLSWASLSYPDHASFWSQCCHEHHSPIQIMLHSEVSVVMSITLLSRTCFILKSVLSWASLSYPDHASFWSQCCHEHHSPIQIMLHSEVSVVMSITLLSRSCFILKSVLSWASLSYPDHASFWSQCCHEHHSPIQNMLHSEVSVVMSITLLSRTCFILKSVLSWASLSYPDHASFWSQCCHEHHSPIQNMLHSEVSIVMSITLLSRSCFILKSVLSWASLSYPDHASFWSQCCHEHHSPIQIMLHSEVSVVMSITLLSRSCFILKSVLSWASLSYPDHASFWSQYCHEHHSPIQIMLHSEVSVVMSITLLSRTCFILKSVLSWASLSYPEHASFWSQCCHEHHSPIQNMLHSEVSVVMSITLLSRSCFILKSVLSWASLSYPEHASFGSQCCHEHHSPIQNMLHSEVSVVMSITLLSRTCFIRKSVLSWASLSYPDHASFWSQCCHEHHSPIQNMLHSEVSVVMSITLLSRSCFILKSVLSWASLSYPEHASFWSQCCHEHHSPIQNMLHSEVSVVMSITLLSRSCFILKSVLSWASLSYPEHASFWSQVLSSIQNHASFWSQCCHEHHSPIQNMLHSEVSVVMSITLLSRTCFILKSVLSWASLSYPDHASFGSQCCHEHHSPIQNMLHSEVSVVMSITLLSRSCFILKSVLSWASLSYPDHASFWSQCCHEHHSPTQNMLHSEVSVVMSITLLSRSCFILKSVLSWASLSYPEHASFGSQCCHGFATLGLYAHVTNPWCASSGLNFVTDPWRLSCKG